MALYILDLSICDVVGYCLWIIIHASIVTITAQYGS